MGNKGILAFFTEGKNKYSPKNLQNQRRVCEGLVPRVGTADDFYITCGAFQTALHRVPVTLGSSSLDLDVGVLPPPLQSLLLAAGVEGIVGTAILIHFMVAYMPRRRRLILVARRQDL